jgi:hypothetical protein
MNNHRRVLIVVLTAAAVLSPVTVTLNADPVERRNRFETRDVSRPSDRQRLRVSAREKKRIGRPPMRAGQLRAQSR